ncbi:MAG: IS3 family transposase [Nitrospirota bacterium]
MGRHVFKTGSETFFFCFTRCYTVQFFPASSEYIEVFYNRTRRYSTLEYRSPAEFETMTVSQA